MMGGLAHTACDLFEKRGETRGYIKKRMALFMSMENAVKVWETRCACFLFGKQLCGKDNAFVR